MSKHYEAHDRYEGHDDYYYGYNGSVDSDGFAHQKADLSHHEVRGEIVQPLFCKFLRWRS